MRRVAPTLRIAFAASLAAVFFAPFLAQSAIANDKKDKKAEVAAAQALLAKSKDLSNIEADGSPPFVLNAKIHYQIGTQSADGEGQIIWLAPDHYREAYTAPNYSYTEIVRDGYRYLARTNDEMPLVMYELERTVQVAIHAGLTEKEAIKDVAVHENGNDVLTCMTFRNRYLSKRCFDHSADIVSLNSSPPPSAAVLHQSYEFADFADLGTKRFPQKIAFRGGDDHVIEVNLDRLALLKDVPVDAFTVPVSTLKESWCAKPKIDLDIWNFLPLASDSMTGSDAFFALAAAKASIYVVVGPNGRARTVTVLQSAKPIPKKEMDDLVKSLRFAPLLCGRRGVEYEMEFGPIR